MYIQAGIDSNTSFSSCGEHCREAVCTTALEALYNSVRASRFLWLTHSWSGEHGTAYDLQASAEYAHWIHTAADDAKKAVPCQAQYAAMHTAQRCQHAHESISLLNDWWC